MNDKILTALKARYKSPAHVMAALGLDASLLRTPCGRDEEGEELSPAQRLHAILKGKLSAQELDVVGKLLAQLSGPEDEEGEPDEDDDDYYSEDEEATLGEGENEEQLGKGTIGKQQNPDPRTTSSGFPKYRESDPEKEAEDEPVVVRRVGLKNPGARARINVAGDTAAKAALDAALPNMARVGTADAFCFDASGANRNCVGHRPINASAKQRAGFAELFPGAAKIGSV